MPINADQCGSMLIIADHWRSIPINVDQCRLMPDQFCLIWHWSALIGIERNWEELIGIDRHWSELINIGINARILSGIDRHWSALGIDRGSPASNSIVIEHVKPNIIQKFSNIRFMENSLQNFGPDGQQFYKPVWKSQHCKEPSLTDYLLYY